MNASINNATPIVLDRKTAKSNSKNCQYRNRLFTTNNPVAANKNSIFLLIVYQLKLLFAIKEELC